MNHIHQLLITDWELYMRLFLSLIFGFLVGLERAYKRKTAGIRTHTLVCLGSCLVMILSGMSYGAYRDPMRLAAQVVSGIGFIGAGVIWQDSRNIKRGLTTAADLWVTSAVGLVIGYGAYDIAIMTGFFMMIAMNLHKLAIKFKILPKNGTLSSEQEEE